MHPTAVSLVQQERPDPPALALGGLGYKYINEALSWKEEEGEKRAAE